MNTIQIFRSRAGRLSVSLALPILVLALSLAGPAPAVGSVPGEAHRAAPARSTGTIGPSAVGDPIVLYDGALGGTPNTQGFTFQAFPPTGATQTFADGVTTLTTTQSVSAGYFEIVTSKVDLNRTTGYTVTFAAQVAAESHSNNNRAGFSIIAISSDKKGIELGFWTNEIWAQADGIVPPGSGIFTHAEGAAFDTTAALTTFQLYLKGDTYTLSVGGTPILTGSVRDYSAFTGPVDPYETPNFLFLGDDTTSAGATLKLSYVAV